MKRKFYDLFRLLLLVLLAGVLLPNASTKAAIKQTEEITGQVFDEKSESMPGVTVKIKNGKTVTQTDLNGKFKIQANIGDVLSFSFTGYETRNVVITSKSLGRISLQPSVSALNEVVVIGYGQVKKSDLTGAVSSFSAKDVDQYPVTSIDQALQGKVSGVQITQSSGAPGAGMSFIVRGGNSLGSNQPLIILDGYPIDLDNGNLSQGAVADVGQQPGVNPLASLNPNDIASVEILKDASSTAIYGSRGANGVVIITTKRGKKGKDQVSLTYRTDVSDIRKKIPVLHTKDFIAYSNEGALNDGIDSLYKSAAIATLQNTDNNWQDQIYRTAVSNTSQLSVSGGDDRSQYYLAGDYADVQGIVLNSNYKRGNVRLNYDRK